MFNIIKQSNIELNNLDSSQVVKVASIISRLRSWYNSLIDPEYSARISKLQSDSSAIKIDMDRLSRYMNDINTAISSGNLDKYSYSLERFKEAISSLAYELSIIKEDINEATPPEEAIIDDKTIAQIIFKPTTLQNNKIRIPIVNAFKNAGFKQEEIDSIINDISFIKDIEEALMNNAKVIGSAAEVRGGKNQEKRLGEIWITYQTNNFTLSNHPVVLAMKVVLTDLSNRKQDPRPVMVLTRVIDIKVKRITKENINECLDCNSAIDERWSQFAGTNFEWFFDPDKIKEKISKFNPANRVDAKKTPVSKEEFLESVKRVWNQIFDISLTNEGLGAIWGQVALETGNLSSMMNYNLGNIKATPEWSQNNIWTGFNCGDILNGKEIKFTGQHPNCFFRAYNSLDESVINYLKLLEKSYKPAIEAALQGDVKGFVDELYDRKYFTANKDLYAKGVIGIYNKHMGKENSEPSSEPVDNIDQEIRELMNYFNSYAKYPLTNIVKQAIAENILDKSDISIKIISNNYPAKVEYASILGRGIEDVIGGDVNIVSDNQEVELKCSIAGNIESVVRAISGIESIVANEFSRRNGIEVYGSIMPAGSSELDVIKEEKIERERRKFAITSLSDGEDKKEMGEIEKFEKNISSKFPLIGEGRYRKTYDIGKGYVIKIPTSIDGLHNNWEEASTFRKDRRLPYARCKLLHNKYLIMEKLIEPVDKSNLPSWVSGIDCGQVGYNQNGQLRIYDYGF